MSPIRSSEAAASEGGAGAPPDPAGTNRAPDLTREYLAEGITVEWYATRCIHSANCVRALPRVFDPRRRPWVNPSAASVDDLARAVLRCPTGALHFVRHDGGAQETPDEPATARPSGVGPLYLRGDVEVRDASGAVLRRDTRTALCACGRSARAPFCDNACRTLDREP
ncbi:MAG: (4Fe-4S)-binding protein [Gemmatimonadales bacterium]